MSEGRLNAFAHNVVSEACRPPRKGQVVSAAVDQRQFIISGLNQR